MDGAALGDVARIAAAHRWSFTLDGLGGAAAVLGWEVGEQRGVRVRLGTPFERASALLDGERVLAIECSLVPPVEVDPADLDAVARVEAQMKEAFDDAVGAVEGAVGPPAFRGAGRSPAFPRTRISPGCWRPGTWARPGWR